MESLIEQIRVRYSGQENKVDPSSDKKINPTISSFKAEKKKLQGWIQRQFSRQMSQNFDTDGIEQATAVAAAAYAVLLLNQSGFPEQEKISEGHKPSLVRTKSRKEDRTVSFHEFGEVSKQSPDLSSEKFPESVSSNVSDTKITHEEPTEKLEGSIKRSPTSTDDPRSLAPSLEKVPTITDKPRGRIPSFRKVPSFTDKPTPSIGNNASFADKPTSSIVKTPSFTDTPAPSILKSPISDKPAIPMQKIPTLTEQQLNKSNSLKSDGSASKIPTPKRDAGSSSKTSTPSNKPLSKADEWELAELARVNKRYEKINERIRSWENKKKGKARKKLDSIEGELAIRRAKAAEKYQVEMQRIKQIVGAANNKAKERQLYEEIKVKRKANVMRETGKNPDSCFCC